MRIIILSMETSSVKPSLQHRDKLLQNLWLMSMYNCAMPLQGNESDFRKGSFARILCCYDFSNAHDEAENNMESVGISNSF